MSATQNPVYQELLQNFEKSQHNSLSDNQKFSAFLQNVKFLVRAQRFNEENIFGYIEKNAAYLQEHFSKSDNIIEFFHKHLGLNYSENTYFDNAPIHLERLTNAQRLFSTMIDYSVMPNVKEECADAFLDNIFHFVDHGRLDGFCGNNTDGYFIENTFIAFSQFIDFCEKENIYLDKDHKKKISKHISSNFLYHWSGYIYTDDENGLPYLLADKVALGQEIISVYFEYILKNDTNEINQFLEHIKHICLEQGEDRGLGPVEEFIIPFTEKYLLSLEISPNTTYPVNNSSTFKI